MNFVEKLLLMLWYLEKLVVELFNSNYSCLECSFVHVSKSSMSQWFATVLFQSNMGEFKIQFIIDKPLFGQRQFFIAPITRSARLHSKSSHARLSSRICLWVSSILLFGKANFKLHAIKTLLFDGNCEEWQSIVWAPVWILRGDTQGSCIYQALFWLQPVYAEMGVEPIVGIQASKKWRQCDPIGIFP